VPYNRGAIPESAFAPLECFVADAQEPTEEPFTSVIPSFVDTAVILSDELPLVHELCPLPTISYKRTSSRRQKAAVLTSSEHLVIVKNKKAEVHTKHWTGKR
jgi:hypothetical protein